MRNARALALRVVALLLAVAPLGPAARAAGAAPRDARRLPRRRGLDRERLRPGARQPAPRPRRQPVPGLRLRRRLRLCGDAAPAAGGLAGAVRPRRAPQGRRRDQRPAAQARRRQRRQRLVGEPAARGAAARAGRLEVQAPPFRLRLGPGRRPRVAAHAGDRVRARRRARRRAQLAVRREADAGRARARPGGLAGARRSPRRAAARHRLGPGARVQRRRAALAGRRQRPDYELLASDDARAMAGAAPRPRQRRRTRCAVPARAGGAPPAPEAAARQRRCRAWPCAAPSEWPDFNAVLEALAAELPRGQLPRAFVGEQNYWTLVGVDGGGERSGADQRRRRARGRPRRLQRRAVRADGRRPLATWADVRIGHGLRDGYLPQPRVRWQRDRLHARHRRRAPTVTRDARRTAGALHAAQHRHAHAPLHAVARAAAVAGQPAAAVPEHARRREPDRVAALAAPARLAVDDGPPLRRSPEPQRVAALPFDGGTGPGIAAAAPAAARTLHDGQAHASAAMQLASTLAPGAAQTLGWVAPLAGARHLHAADLDGRSRRPLRCRRCRVARAPGPRAAARRARRAADRRHPAQRAGADPDVARTARRCSRARARTRAPGSATAR